MSLDRKMFDEAKNKKNLIIFICVAIETLEIDGMNVDRFSVFPFGNSFDSSSLQNAEMPLHQQPSLYVYLLTAGRRPFNVLGSQTRFGRFIMRFLYVNKQCYELKMMNIPFGFL